MSTIIVHVPTSFGNQEMPRNYKLRILKCLIFLSKPEKLPDLLNFPWKIFDILVCVSYEVTYYVSPLLGETYRFHAVRLVVCHKSCVLN